MAGDLGAPSGMEMRVAVMTIAYEANHRANCFGLNLARVSSQNSYKVPRLQGKVKVLRTSIPTSEDYGYRKFLTSSVLYLVSS